MNVLIFVTRLLLWIPSVQMKVEIALKNPKVKVIKNAFEDFTKQRNLALDSAKNDWVLFLDADERITRELEKRDSRNYQSSGCKGRLLHLQNFFLWGKKKINFSGTQNDKNFRLFKKSKSILCKAQKSARNT